MDVQIPKVNERKGPYIKEEVNGYFPRPISNLQNPIQFWRAKHKLEQAQGILSSLEESWSIESQLFLLLKRIW